MASCQPPEEYHFPALPDAGTFCCPEPVPLTLYVVTEPCDPASAEPRPCHPGEAVLTIDGVSYPWDEARQAWVGKDGQGLRPADLPPELARLFLTAESH